MNFKTPTLFAYPVQDLTIARNLAAMQVDFIGIDLDQSDSKKLQSLIKEFLAWIEGPKLIGVSAFPLQLQHLDFGLHGFYADSDLSSLQEHIRMQGFDYYQKYKPKNIDYLLINHPEQSIELIPCLLRSSLKQIPEANELISGYFFSPGSEDKTGVFDFDELNTWIEKVQEFY